MSRRLIHYSREPLGEVRSTPPTEREQHVSSYSKPAGLWVSAEGDGDWASWCGAESFAQDCFVHAAQIVLADDHRVLTLGHLEALDRFTQDFGEDYHWGERFTDRRIRWDRVREQHQGLLIAPYQWKRRLSLDWYYTWDCASGCIWDAAAVSHTVPLTDAAMPLWHEAETVEP